MAGLVPLEILDIAEVRIDDPTTNNIDPSVAKKMLQLLVVMQSLLPVKGQFIGLFTLGLDRDLLLMAMTMIVLTILLICWPCRRVRALVTKTKSTQTDEPPAEATTDYVPPVPISMHVRTTSASSEGSVVYQRTLVNPTEVFISLGGQATRYQLSSACVRSRSAQVGRCTPCLVCSRRP